MMPCAQALDQRINRQARVVVAVVANTVTDLGQALSG